MKHKLTNWMAAVAAVVLGTGSAWAQTDVTSTYIVNPSFEQKDASTSLTAPIAESNKGTVTSIYGWVSYTDGGGGYNNHQVMNASTASAAGFGNKTTPTEGSYYYFFRHGWNKNPNNQWRLTSADEFTLPAGTYSLSVDYKAAESKNDGNNTSGSELTLNVLKGGESLHSGGTLFTLNPANTYFNGSDNWRTKTFCFTLTEATPVKLEFAALMKGGVRSDIILDNVKLVTIDPLMESATEEAPKDITQYILYNAAVSSADGWTNGRIASNQQYTGAPDNTYLDNWNGEKNNIYQRVTLPAGVYTLKAATRAVSDLTGANIYALLPNNDNHPAPINAIGNTGGDLGNGWNWSTVDFTVLQESEVQIGFYSETGGGKWAGADNFQLLYKRKVTNADITAAAKEALNASLTTADALHTQGTTYTSGVFGYKNAQDAQTLQAAITTARGVYDNAEATLDAVNAAKTELDNAITTFRDAELNAPSPTQAYTLMVTTDDPSASWNNGYITARANDRKDGGLYNTKYQPANDNYAQAFYLVPAEGTNRYKISFTDAEGQTRYICTGVQYGGDAKQIRTTTDESKALVLKVEREGAYIKFFNTEASLFMGGQDPGLYTTGTNARFTLTETTAQHTVSYAFRGRFSTIVLPYAVSALPASVTNAYSVDAVEGENLTLTRAEQLEANKAYLLEGTAGETYSFTGINIAFDEPQANGILKGCYTLTDVPVANNYVLQVQDGAEAFYKVTTANIKCGSNKCYLVGPADSPVKAFYLDGNEATAIRTLQDLTEANAPIYDLNGRQHTTLQKGINIVGGRKIIVK